MILKTINFCNEQTTAKAMRSSSLPHRNLVPSAKISNSEGDLVKGFDNTISNGDRRSMGLANIQMRLMTSLVFVFLPSLTQLPSQASSAMPLVPAVPTITQASATAALTPTAMDSDDLISRRRSMDAARLTLEDYSGRKRGKIPNSVKKQMDMQDRRLAICQEMSRDEWEWEQCFYYGTNNGGGAMYFDGGVFVENNSNTKAATNAAKQKIPTW